MKRMLTTDDLARDDRFVRIRVEETLFDPRSVANERDRKRGKAKSDTERGSREHVARKMHIEVQPRKRDECGERRL